MSTTKSSRRPAPGSRSAKDRSTVSIPSAALTGTAARSSSPIAEGQKAPAFALVDQNGDTHHLKDFLGRPVVLYFYPKDDTPGCTTEACGFRDAWPDLERTTAVVLGVSPDSTESHANFVDKFDLPFFLLADRIGRDGIPKVCDKYGVWREKTMYGRTTMGVVRTTYLIDEAGKVARRWDRVKVDGHAEEVLAAVRAIRTPIVPGSPG